MKKIMLSLGILLSSCDALFTGSREPGIPIALVVIDKKSDRYVFQRYDFDETSGTDKLLLKSTNPGTPFGPTDTPIGIQVSLGGNRLYVGLKDSAGLNDRILFFTDEQNSRDNIKAPQIAGRPCSIQSFRVNDAETYLASLVSCGEIQDVTQQKLWVRSLSQGGVDVLIDNPIPNNQPIAVADNSFQSSDYGTFPYTITNSRLFFVKNIIGDSTSSSLYTLSLTANPLQLPSGYIPEKVSAVNALGTASVNTDGGPPNIGGIAATREGVYRIEEDGKLGAGKVLPETYSALWSVSTSALKRLALWNPNPNVNFNRTLKFLSGSNTPTVNTQGRVRDLTFAPITGNAYYLDASSLVQVDVSSPPVNNNYQTLSQSYASLGLENPISIGWILK